MDQFRAGTQTAARVWFKQGSSPVTEADIAVDAFLNQRLGRLLPEAAWLSEETTDDAARLDRRLVWVVDPIDGTRSFAAGQSEWCVSIALLSDGAPGPGDSLRAGPGPPLRGGHRRGSDGQRRRLRVPKEARPGDLRLSGPKPLMDRFARGAGPVACLPKIPSLALRIARVADATLDVGFASTNSHDWDIAAADLILREAGGRLTDLAGATPVYNRPRPTHGDLIAVASWLHPRAIRAMTT